VLNAAFLFVYFCFDCKLSVNCNRFALCFTGVYFFSRCFSIPEYCEQACPAYFLNQVVACLMADFLLGFHENIFYDGIPRINIVAAEFS